MEMREEVLLHVPEAVLRDLLRFARERDVERVILFGSRARGDNRERSDVDLAVRGGDVDGFYWDVMEKTESLLMFDIVDLGRPISSALQEVLEREGIVLYEKAG